MLNLEQLKGIVIIGKDMSKDDIKSMFDEIIKEKGGVIAKMRGFQYRELDYLSRSEVKPYFDKTPIEAKLEFENIKKSHALTIGSLFDTFFLDRMRFSETFKLLPRSYEKTYIDKNGKIQPNSLLGIYKKIKAQIENTGFMPVKVSDAIKARNAAIKARSYPDVIDIFKDFIPHLVFCCQDAETGLFLKCEVDITNLLFGFFDLKKMKKRADDFRSFSRAADRAISFYDYPFQAAMYSRIIAQVLGIRRDKIKFGFIVVGEDPPHLLRKIIMPLDYMTVAHERVDIALRNYSLAQANLEEGLSETFEAKMPAWYTPNQNEHQEF